jgi:site-specific recombinase XerD
VNDTRSDKERKLSRLKWEARDLQIRFDRDDLVQTANELAGPPLSPRTIEDYTDDFRLFSEWCAERQLQPRPASPVTIELYITELYKRGYAISTIARHLAVLRHAHAGMADPTDTRRMRNIWKNMRRERGVAPRRQAKAVGLIELRTMLVPLHKDKSPRAARDRAMITVGWCGGMRAAEVVALDWQDVESVPEGVIIRIRRSKTDQEGKGEKVGLPWLPEPDVCAARALAALREVCLDVPGFGEVETSPVFLRSSWGGSGGLNLLPERAHRKAVNRAVKRAAKLAKLPHPEKYSSHSLRRGLATEGERQGVPARAMRKHGRWKTSAAHERYIEEPGLWKNNVLSMIFDF